MPTIGLPKSASPKPTARSMARFGARSTPSVTIRLRRSGEDVMGTSGTPLCTRSGCGEVHPSGSSNLVVDSMRLAHIAAAFPHPPPRGDFMDIRQLDMFRAVAEEGSFTRAAERLHVSQSAISRQVKLLEDELGGMLLHRGARRVALTHP